MSDPHLTPAEAATVAQMRRAEFFAHIIVWGVPGIPDEDRKSVLDVLRFRVGCERALLMEDDEDPIGRTERELPGAYRVSIRDQLARAEAAIAEIEKALGLTAVGEPASDPEAASPPIV